MCFFLDSSKLPLEDVSAHSIPVSGLTTGCRRKQLFQWAARRAGGDLQNIRANHHRIHIVVHEQLVHSAAVDTGLEKMRGKGMPQCIDTDELGNARLSHCASQCALRAFRIQIMASDNASMQIRGYRGRQEHSLPCPRWPARIFRLQGMQQKYAT